MARFTPVDNTSSPSFKQGATPEKYIDLGAYINEIDQPDNREQLVKTYGDQLIGGAIAFTRLVGASNNVGHADEVTYWEEARLMKTQNGTMAATAAADTGAKLITTAAAHTIVTGDVVMIKVNGKNAKLTRQIEGAEVYFSAR